MLIEAGYHVPAGLQAQLTSGKNHIGNAERRMSSWSQSFSGKSRLCLNGTEISSAIIIDPRAIIDAAARLASSIAARTEKLPHSDPYRKKSPPLMFVVCVLLTHFGVIPLGSRSSWGY